MAQSFLALEVVVERSFGDVSGGEDSIDAGALEPVSVNLAKRCLQQALSRALRVAQLGRPALQLLRCQQHTNRYGRGVAQEVKRIIGAASNQRREIASVIVACEETISPKCHSTKALLVRQARTGASTSPG